MTMNYEKFQLAFYAHTEQQAEEIKRILGLSEAEWIEDIATGQVSVRGGPLETSVAKLRFCYAFPLEIEILTYLEGPHWHESKPEFQRGDVFISHIGFHLDAGEQAPMSDLPAPAQRMHTTSHTNPFVREKGWTYRYEIFDRHRPGQFAAGLGADVKYIWRILP